MENFTEVVAALIRRGDTFMICRRPAHKSCGLLWEFVGGKVEPGESKAVALMRECREELAIDVAVGSVFTEVTHAYPDITVHLTLFNAEIVSGAPQLLEHCDLQWIAPVQINDYDFCPADKDILALIKRADAAVVRMRELLFACQDEKYRDFSAKLIPNIPPETIIGVRAPDLKKVARTVQKEAPADAFLSVLPHTYHEENCLHGMLIAAEKDFSRTVALLNDFLPHIDNWAVCDTIAPKAFVNVPPELLETVKVWVGAAHAYTIRFGIGCLMRYYLDARFQPEYLDWVAAVQSEEYYVNMMRAWYFATALAKQYDSAVKLLESRALDKWTHNKTIQKAIESYRISDARKEYLRTLRIKK